MTYRLTIHGISQESWTRRYGVLPFSHPCSIRNVAGRVDG